MPNSLLQTKLFSPPLRQGLVARPHLIETFSAGVTGKMTLVSAPAGYGKTTAVIEWLSQVERPYAWLSLDDEDNDPHRFFTYVIAALGPIVGSQDLALPSTALPIKAVTTLLANQLLSISEQIILVLDDYHRIETSAIHEAITFLCESLPPNLHWVLISRSDPPLPLARMRARGDLNEVRQKDLRLYISANMRHYAQQCENH